jgi:hypothetical protein
MGKLKEVTDLAGAVPAGHAPGAATLVAGLHHPRPGHRHHPHLVLPVRSRGHALHCGVSFPPPPPPLTSRKSQTMHYIHPEPQSNDLTIEGPLS